MINKSTWGIVLEHLNNQDMEKVKKLLSDLCLAKGENYNDYETLAYDDECGFKPSMALAITSLLESKDLKIENDTIEFLGEVTSKELLLQHELKLALKQFSVSAGASNYGQVEVQDRKGEIPSIHEIVKGKEFCLGINKIVLSYSEEKLNFRAIRNVSIEDYYRIEFEVGELQKAIKTNYEDTLDCMRNKEAGEELQSVQY